MSQRSLQRAIARVTGDSFATIERLGFQPFDPRRVQDDGDEWSTGPTVLDWDRLTSVPLARLVAEECCDAA